MSNDYPSRRTTAVLLVLTAAGEPFLARFLAEIDSTVALQLPMAVCAVALCTLLGGHLMPYLALVAAGCGEAVFMALRGGEPFGPSTVAALGQGKWQALLWVVAAIGLGHLASIFRMRRNKLWRRRMKSNIRLLLRRPGVLIDAYRWPLVLLAVGTTLDTITTMAFMRSTGPGDELHPAMRMMAEEFGITLGVPLASVARVGFVIFVACLWRRWCGGILIACGLLYLLAAGSNYFGWLESLTVWLILR